MKRKFKYISSIVLVLIIVISNVNCVFAEDKKEEDNEYIPHTVVYESEFKKYRDYYNFVDGDGKHNFIKKTNLKDTLKEIYPDASKKWIDDYFDLIPNCLYQYNLTTYFSDKINKVEYTKLYTTKPMIIKNDGSLVPDIGTKGYMIQFKSKMSITNSSNEITSLNQWSIFNYGNSPTKSQVTIIYPYNDNGKCTYLDENGNEKKIDDVIDNELFKKPYYKLSEWNALMDKKGTEYQKYKLKSRKDIPSAKTILNGLKNKFWTLKDDSYFKGQAVESLLKSQIVRYTNVYYEVNADLSFNQRHIISMGNMTYKKVIDNTGNSFYLFGPRKSTDKAMFTQLIDVTSSIKNIELKRIEWKDVSGDFYGISKGKTFIVDDNFAFDGKYDKNGDFIDGSEIGHDGSTAINTNDNEDGSTNNIGNNYDPNKYKPQKPSGLNPIEWINYWTSNIGTFITDTSNAISDIANKTSGFFGFLGSTFNFIPSQIWALIIASISVVVILRVFGR